MQREISFVCEPSEWLKRRELEDTTIFSLLREEFVKPRAIRLYSQSEPLEKDLAGRKRDDGKRDFDFGLYLEHVSIRASYEAPDAGTDRVMAAGAGQTFTRDNRG